MAKDPKLDPDATFVPRAPTQKGANGEWPTVVDPPAGDAPPDTLRTAEVPETLKPKAPKGFVPPPPIKAQPTVVLPPGYTGTPPPPPLLDQKSRRYLAAAVAGTVLVGAVLWKLASPAPPPPEPTIPKNMPKGFTDAIRPAYTTEKPMEVVTPEHRVFVDEVTDAGLGSTRTVKTEAGTIQILSTPEVMISRNGVELGKTPITLTLPLGSVTLQVANKAEGLTRTVTLEVLRGANGPKRFEFARGHIEVRAPAGTAVTLDGRAVGKAPLAQLGVWPGTHTIDVTYVSGDKDSRKLEVPAGDTVSTDFEAPVQDSKLSP